MPFLIAIVYDSYMNTNKCFWFL